MHVQARSRAGLALTLAIAAALAGCNSIDGAAHRVANSITPYKVEVVQGNFVSKEQVAAMLQRMLNIREDEMPKYMDATDALGAAYCHFLQMGRPETGDRHYSSWKDFATKNASRIEKGTGMTGPQAKLLAAINRTTHK